MKKTTPERLLLLALIYSEVKGYLDPDPWGFGKWRLDEKARRQFVYDFGIPTSHDLESVFGATEKDQMKICVLIDELSKDAFEQLRYQIRSARRWKKRKLEREKEVREQAAKNADPIPRD